jgi:hypothetical protein
MTQPIICPWCGTNYADFRPNCKNCGGPIRLPEPPREVSTPLEAEEFLVAPPPAPRPIADSYVWKLMGGDGSSILGFIFALIGGIFFIVGSGLTLGIVTAFVGIPFTLLGLVLGAGGAALLRTRYGEMQKLVNVLRHGQPTRGQIVSAEANYNVEVNGRNPWSIAYRFHLNERDYTGKVSTLNAPGPQLQPGRAATILYLPELPELNALYPHP